MAKKQAAKFKLKDLDSAIANLEGGKSQVKMGDARQMRKLIFDLIKNNPEARALLFKYLGK